MLHFVIVFFDISQNGIELNTCCILDCCTVSKLDWVVFVDVSEYVSLLCKDVIELDDIDDDMFCDADDWA